MARVSQIMRSPWRSRGTKNDGERRRSSARTSGIVAVDNVHREVQPGELHNSHPRSDQAP